MKMKKGGYDYQISIVHIIVAKFSPLLLLLLNLMSYVSYPASLAVSLLVALPKKGNLRLACNFRGIQMLRALGALYDRIIAIRLNRWLGVSDEQSAYQKLKSTLHHLFTIRLLTEIAKKNRT